MSVDAAYQLLPILAGLLLLGLLLRPLTKKLYIPHPLVLLVLGIGYAHFSPDPLFRAISDAALRDVVFSLFLPLLIFSAAFQLDASRLARNRTGIITLAVPLAAISIVLTATVIYYGIDHPTGFPWLAAFITAAMLSATDSQGIRDLLPQGAHNENIRTLVITEDLFSGAIAIVLFALLVFFASNPNLPVVGTDLALFVAWNVIGGGAVGLGVGILTLVVMRKVSTSAVEVVLYTLLAAFLSYQAAAVSDMSGIVAVLVTALIAGRTLHEDLHTHVSKHEGLAAVDEFWKFFEHLAGSLLFLLIGLNIQIDFLLGQWLAILIGAAAVIVARVFVILGAIPFLHRKNPDALSEQDTDLLFLTGTRGAVTIGLAMSVPAALPYAWTIEAIGLGVVLVTLLAPIPFVETWQKYYARLANEAD